MARLHEAEAEKMWQAVVGAASTVTLHEWDWDPDAETDRRDGLFGPQVANRERLDDDLRVTVVNPQPGMTTCHYVVWRGDKAQVWSPPVKMKIGDELRLDLHRDVRIG